MVKNKIQYLLTLNSLKSMNKGSFQSLYLSSGKDCNFVNKVPEKLFYMAKGINNMV